MRYEALPDTGVTMNYAKLSKEISCALRRHPEYYGLEPDRAGFVGIDDLIRGINHSHPDAMPVTRNHIEEALAHSSKQRHEFYQDKIRALYGMSFRGRRTLAPRVPPKVLYHGTTPRVLDAIMREGLRPMDRRMVYLSEDFEIAASADARHSWGCEPVVLAVNTVDACANNVEFYQETSHVWLCSYVSPAYLQPISWD